MLLFFPSFGWNTLKRIKRLSAHINQPCLCIQYGNVYNVMYNNMTIIFIFQSSIADKTIVWNLDNGRRRD